MSTRKVFFFQGSKEVESESADGVVVNAGVQVCATVAKAWLVAVPSTRGFNCAGADAGA